MKLYRLVVLVFLGILITGCQHKKREGKPRLLVFSKTMGFKHSSIPSGIAAIQKLGDEHGFIIDTTKNAALFEDEILADYSAIVFLSTTGNVLDHRQEAAFERYIQAGGGFVGIHAATDTEYDWNWFGRLVGAYFESHPSGTPEADFHIKDRNFAATSFFKDSVWHRTDELYNFKKIYPPINVVMTVDESSYDGGTNGDFHPMSWYHEYDGGRSFYTALGHTDESFSEPLFLQHLLGGIQYAIGENYELNYDLAKTQLPPEQDRFSKEVLSVGKFYEPTEMTVLPNNDVLIAQRRGQVIRYNASTGELEEVARLDVYDTALEAEGVNVENGLMGLQKDPDYAKNHWIYLYYSPTGERSVNVLSRFKYKDGNFDLSSEQLILEVATDREVCCHTGGSIAFGPDKLLYLSTGDNSTPFDEPGAAYVNHGFAPLNDNPGKSQYDARRSSGNTNDLRGKVLRIRMNEDGSYEIPDGNLFPQGTSATRPEIYTMGHRNPYRISVDAKTSFLYWGDVGPDAQGDSLITRGPRGYDEINQAQSAGNFGWPLFIADNKPYVAYNYNDGESGEAFDPEKPLNLSKNNTGIEELPEAMPAFVYYPYAPTPDFPQVGSGGRNAMAGPVYYSDLYDGEVELPAYFDGKLIAYDWMRGWMKAVSFFEDGSFNKMEPFASEIELNSLIDMEIGPDGRLYLLEYGSGWFTQNPDSGLSFVAFNGGNRPPVIDNLIVNQDSGPLPLEVELQVEARDREKDPITYVWDLGDGMTKETSEPKISYKYERAGEYLASVSVRDELGAEAKSEAIGIVAGNTRPKVSVNIKSGNSSFYMPGVPVSYEVTVEDPDTEGVIDPKDIFVSVDYLTGMDETQLSAGHKKFSAIENGKALSLSLDCKACHKQEERSIGPSYLEVAQKYKDDPGAIAYLQEKIINGGAGVWGEVAMAAHPNLTQSETRMLGQYIMSLALEDDKSGSSLPTAGTIFPDTKNPTAVFQISASYTDEGSGEARPLTGYAATRLKSSTTSFSDKIKHQGMIPITFNNMDLFLLPPAESWFVLEKLDLTGIKGANLIIGWQQPPATSLDFEMRLGAPDGTLIGSGTMPKPVPGQEGGMAVLRLKEDYKLKDQEVYFIYKPEANGERGEAPVALINLSFTGI